MQGMQDTRHTTICARPTLALCHQACLCSQHTTAAAATNQQLLFACFTAVACASGAWSTSTKQWQQLLPNAKPACPVWGLSPKLCTLAAPQPLPAEPPGRQQQQSLAAAAITDPHTAPQPGRCRWWPPPGCWQAWLPISEQAPVCAWEASSCSRQWWTAAVSPQLSTHPAAAAARPQGAQGPRWQQLAMLRGGPGAWHWAGWRQQQVCSSCRAKQPQSNASTPPAATRVPAG